MTSETPRFPIRVAAQRANVSVATLRAWERRYGAVEPARTAGEQRLYSDADVERLVLLRRLTAQGHSISGIASAETGELRRLVDATEPSASAVAAPSVVSVHAADDDRTLAACMRAVTAQDSEMLYHLLLRDAIRSTPFPFIEGIVAPLSRRIGDEWAAGRVSEAQERAASGAIRLLLAFLMRALGTPRPPRPKHRVLVTTLNGERHENGALMAAVIATLAGCEVSYPGADLPAPAIAEAAKRADADIVALSMIDTNMPRITQRELAALRHHLPARVAIVVGGSAAPIVAEAAPRVTRIDSLAGWQALLAEPVARWRAPS